MHRRNFLTSAVGAVLVPLIPAKAIASAGMRPTTVKPNKAYAQPVMPKERPKTGDLWINTDDSNKVYRWDGSCWVSISERSTPNV